MELDALPLIWQTKPTPHASCSNDGSYRPWAAGKPIVLRAVLITSKKGAESIGDSLRTAIKLGITDVCVNQASADYLVRHVSGLHINCANRHVDGENRLDAAQHDFEVAESGCPRGQ